jgi:hypothetical protein
MPFSPASRMHGPQALVGDGVGELDAEVHRLDLLGAAAENLEPAQRTQFLAVDLEGMKASGMVMGASLSAMA